MAVALEVALSGPFLAVDLSEYDLYYLTLCYEA